MKQLWQRIKTELDKSFPIWKTQIHQMGQVAAINQRNHGQTLTDPQILEGMVKAILSNSVDWAKIEPLLPSLKPIFHEFDLQTYSNLCDQQFQDIVNWFQSHKAGSATQKTSLNNLRQVCRVLLQKSAHCGGLDAWLQSIDTGRPEAIPLALGGKKSPNKLPTMGIPIASEAAKNWGFDVAKPDRHVNRALGCWNLIQFRHWQDPLSDYSTPSATEAELIEVILIIDRWKYLVKENAGFIDNAIWLLCAISGVHFTNPQLRAMVQQGSSSLSLGQAQPQVSSSAPPIQSQQQGVPCPTSLQTKEQKTLWLMHQLRTNGILPMHHSQIKNHYEAHFREAAGDINTRLSDGANPNYGYQQPGPVVYHRTASGTYNLL